MLCSGCLKHSFIVLGHFLCFSPTSNTPLKHSIGLLEHKMCFNIKSRFGDFACLLDNPGDSVAGDIVFCVIGLFLLTSYARIAISLGYRDK